MQFVEWLVRWLFQCNMTKGENVEFYSGEEFYKEFITINLLKPVQKNDWLLCKYVFQKVGTLDRVPHALFLNDSYPYWAQPYSLSTNRQTEVEKSYQNFRQKEYGNMHPYLRNCSNTCNVMGAWLGKTTVTGIPLYSAQPNAGN